MNKVIVLDAGHGGTDPGAVNGLRLESTDVLSLALAVRDKLSGSDAVVVLTREDNSRITLSERVALANSLEADLFVSLHRNAFSASTANGVEIWVETNAGAVQVGAATEVLERLDAVGIQNNRGIKKGAYRVCTETNMPAMLVELGFISNIKDNALFDTNFEFYAEAIAHGICAALGVEYTEAGQTVDKQYARIQLGAYTWPDNEIGLRTDLERIRALGLECFPVYPDTSRGEN